MEKARREMKDCTFKPSINRPKRSKSAPKVRPPSASVHERLGEYGKKVEEKRELRKKALEEHEKKEIAPLKPKIPEYAGVNKGRKRASSQVTRWG